MQTMINIALAGVAAFGLVRHWRTARFMDEEEAHHGEDAGLAARVAALEEIAGERETAHEILLATVERVRRRLESREDAWDVAAAQAEELRRDVDALGKARDDDARDLEALLEAVNAMKGDVEEVMRATRAHAERWKQLDALLREMAADCVDARNMADQAMKHARRMSGGGNDEDASEVLKDLESDFGGMERRLLALEHVFGTLCDDLGWDTKTRGRA